MTDDAPGFRSAQRRARREFIRSHHPDAGGNPETFITGLADLDAVHRPSPPAAPAPETMSPRQTWPVSLTTVMLRRLRRRNHKPHSR